MKSGLRYARNQTLVNVMRDYGYVEARGMGVRNRIIPGMRAHSGTEPESMRGGAPVHGSPLEVRARVSDASTLAPGGSAIPDRGMIPRGSRQEPVIEA